jgi:hypothetical protein
MLPSACLDGVRTSDDSHCRAQYPAYACPCHRSTPSLAADGVWLRVGMVRYSFPVRLFHPHHSSRSLALSKTRSWSVCSTLTRPDFHQQVDTSFPNALPNVLIPNGNGNTHNPWTRSQTTFTTGLQHQIELAQLPRPRCQATAPISSPWPSAGHPTSPEIPLEVVVATQWWELA